METNVRILIIFFMIMLVILSFMLGYFVARNSAEMKFLNMQSKLTKMKIDMFKKDIGFTDNVKVKRIKEKDLPPDFFKFLEEMEKEEKENNNDGE